MAQWPAQGQLLRFGLLWRLVAGERAGGKRVRFTLKRIDSESSVNNADRLVRSLGEDAKLPDSVKFDGIRKMTCTAMGAENLITQKWVMGHVTGQIDDYTDRDPKETRKALTKARKAILGK